MSPIPYAPCPACHCGLHHHPMGEIDSHRVAFLIAIADAIECGGLESAIARLCGDCQVLCSGIVDHFAEIRRERELAQAGGIS